VRKMKQQVVFVILDQFADWEYGPLAAELNNPEVDHPAYEVVYASNTLEPITSIGGLRALPHYTFETIPESAAALILVGGDSWRKPEAAPAAELAAGFLSRGKVVGAICDATRFLGAKGLLNNYRHTMNFRDSTEGEPLYQNAGGFVQEDAVRDRNLVTANGNAPYAFTREVLLALGTKPEEADKWLDFFTLGLHQALAKHYPQG